MLAIVVLTFLNFTPRHAIFGIFDYLGLDLIDGPVLFQLGVTQMSKWVTENLEDLLHQINEVPYTDNREGQQLTILMNGFAQLNNKAMDKAATKTRKEFRGWSLDGAEEPTKKPEKKEDSTADELTRLRPIR